MIAVTVIACVAVVALTISRVLSDRAHAAERAEWQAERRGLVDRVIARHTADVVMLERTDIDRVQGPREPDLPPLHNILQDVGAPEGL